MTWINEAAPPVSDSAIGLSPIFLESGERNCYMIINTSNNLYKYNITNRVYTLISSTCPLAQQNWLAISPSGNLIAVLHTGNTFICVYNILMDTWTTSPNSSIAGKAQHMNSLCWIDDDNLIAHGNNIAVGSRLRRYNYSTNSWGAYSAVVLSYGKPNVMAMNSAGTLIFWGPYRVAPNPQNQGIITYISTLVSAGQFWLGATEIFNTYCAPNGPYIPTLDTVSEEFGYYDCNSGVNNAPPALAEDDPAGFGPSSIGIYGTQFIITASMAISPYLRSHSGPPVIQTDPATNVS